LLQASGHLFAKRPQNARQELSLGFVVRQGGFRRDGLRQGMREDCAIVLAALLDRRIKRIAIDMRDG
jgi:hypothetical protein